MPLLTKSYSFVKVPHFMQRNVFHVHVFISAPCLKGTMTDINAENREGILVEDEQGGDASDLLKGSGQEYTPTVKPDGTAVFVVRFEPREEPISLGELNFTTSGKQTVKVEVFNPEDEKLAEDEVCIISN